MRSGKVMCVIRFYENEEMAKIWNTCWKSSLSSSLSRSLSRNLSEEVFLKGILLLFLPGGNADTLRLVFGVIIIFCSFDLI
jgi:hypothetical protein